MPHFLRLEDFLAAQMGKELVARLELDLEWSGAEQEVIRRSPREVYMRDQEDQWSRGS